MPRPLLIGWRTPSKWLVCESRWFLFDSNRANRHFHCARPACGYSFVRYSNMALHEAKHRGEANNNNQDGEGRDAKSDSLRESKCVKSHRALWGCRLP